MKVNGMGSSRGNSGFDIIGKITAVGLKVGDQDAVELEVMRGCSAGKVGRKVLVTLDPEVVGKSKNANFISEDGLESANGKTSALNTVMHFTGARYTSEKGAEDRTMQARWSYKVGVSEGAKANISVEPASLLILPGPVGKQSVHTVWPDDAKVSRGTKDELVADILEVATSDAGKKQNGIYLMNMDGDEFEVSVISLQKAGEGDEKGTYIRRTEDEIKKLIAERTASLADGETVAVVPGGRAFMSNNAGATSSTVDGKPVLTPLDLTVGITRQHIPLSNGEWENKREKTSGKVVNRVENASLRAVGGIHIKTDAFDNELPDDKKFKRILGQIEGYAPSDDQTQKDSHEEAESVSPELDQVDDFDADNPFDDLPEDDTGDAPR